MRRQHQSAIADQRLGNGGFVLEHIEGRARELVGGERRDKRLFIDHRTACDVHDEPVGPECVNDALIYQMMRRGH